MAIKLTTTAEAAKANGCKILVYGKAGTGKTVLCATAPTPVIISAEAGLLSLTPTNIARLVARNELIAREGQDNIPVIEISTIADLQDAFNWASKSKECEQFETICLDSLTEIAEVVLTNAKEQVKDPRQAYGELIEKMSMTVRAFRDLKGKHVYMSAKMELVKDDVIGTTAYMPSMPGSKLGQQLPYWFDEVFHMDIAPKQGDIASFRYFLTQPDIQHVAKDRSGALDRIEQPDLGVVIEKLLA